MFDFDKVRQGFDFEKVLIVRADFSIKILNCSWRGMRFPNRNI